MINGMSPNRSRSGGGETTLGLSARTVINRDDFGLVWNMSLGDGNVLVGREVEITLDGEADLEE